MYPPADPWRAHDEPQADEPTLTQPTVPVFDRGKVPAVRRPTSELPLVERPRPVAGPPKVSWQRTSRASLRKLSDGWGFTAFGVLVLICGWGVWAAAGGQAVVHPLVDLLLVLAVGGLL